uniref:Uncharacterized protein n=1 Tax=Arundo donax TaxID=35708 RepID=A0A0A9DSM4_ARUDO
MLTRKRIVDKNVEETSNSVAISEEQRNSSTCIDSMPLEDSKDSQESSVFLRESSVADEIIPSGVPIGTDELHQGDYSGALQHGAAEVSVLIENSVLSITSALDNHGDVDVFPSGSSTQSGNKASNADKTTRIMEQDIVEEFCQQSLVMVDDANVGLLPLAESCEATGDGHQICKGNMETMVEFPTSRVVPTENVSSMSLDMFNGVAPNVLLSSENYEAKKKDGMGKVDHQGNTSFMLETQNASADGPSSAVSLPALKGDIIITQSSTKKLSADEQHGVLQQDLSLPMVEYAAESGQSIEKSELTQLSSIDMSNSTEAEHGDTLIAPRDAEDGTPMSKYVPIRTHHSCSPLLQRSLDVHKSILADRPSESFAVENLPFVKTSPMWAQIEAMEIFSKVPQRPNFHQFQQHVPELCEGMALGLMLSFVSLAESIKRLSIQDENALFEEKMKGLSSLEAHGFDVRHLRSRIETLLHIKNGRAKLQDAMKKLEEKIAHKEIDDHQLGMQISILNMSVRHLEVHTSIFRCMMQSAVSQKFNHASEISRLKTEASELERSYLSAEQRFNSAITAPW